MLTAGSRIGEYEIVALLGAGGMGEVYRARDPRIGREVALKVLPAEMANDRERLARFEQEARAAGMLNHPNLLMIHEFGVHEGQPYIVSELLEGTTLRERLSGGPISQRKAIELASQIAEGLATAHERGIVHRDLKPENIFITKDGQTKILDFGLAKLRSASEVRIDDATVGKQTDPGTVLGSAGYMSPEQVRGESVDHRSDIFSFGVILYEMLTGQRAFKARSSVETMNAILNTDAPEISSVNPQIGAALQRIVDHCLEKHREGRFQSARDLAFDLAALSDLSTSGGKSARPERRWPAIPLLAAAAVIAIVGVAAFLGGRFNANAPAPRFTRITFRSSFISGARFARDGQSIVYSSSAAGKGQELYVARLGSPEERPLGIGRARILSMSGTGEMAILVEPRPLGQFRWSGTLARMPYAGGAPREIATDVEEADWGASADELAIIRVVGGQHRVEFPIGKPLYQVGGWLSDVDVSPDGKRIAVIEHPGSGDDGTVVLIDAGGKTRPITSSYNSIQGLAWSPGGQEIWFTASKAGASREVYAVTLSGKERRVVGATGVLTLRDIASDGRVLITQSGARNRLFAVPPGETAQRELSWLDWSIVREVSSDGKLILFDESGEGGGSAYSVYLRRSDGSPAVRLGDGLGAGFSPDGRWALAIQVRSNPPRLVMYPIGAGESRVIRDQPWIENARWMPDGSHVVATAHEPNRGTRLYLFDLAGATARPISPEGFRLLSLPSPDGRFVCAAGPGGFRYLIPTSGGPPRILKGLNPLSLLPGWSPDGKSLLWFDGEENPLRIMKLDVNTDRSVLWKEIPVPPSERVGALRVSRDGSTYAFSIFSDSGDVYVLEGAR